ncbi:TPA: hypothetical protein N0F65_008688 [Lagenidium giganteum]|uniref:RNA helicase n=1 Tax=Lagenidium giganteum TaxID=4803 RepID=A0AAV2ZAQ7_9STRA|nr:TPA: hypothetical protein N0F65_008688 [Lagenidium giganteum]
MSEQTGDDGHGDGQQHATALGFVDLPLHRMVQKALVDMRFVQPSAIQLRALPIALFGNDVIAQAKSGTGKTAVFGITAVEHVLRWQQACSVRSTEETPAAGEASSSSNGGGGGGARVGDPLVLVLAPTREIAVQIESVLHQLAAYAQPCIIQTFIGGMPIAQDHARLRHGCHIAVGSPGRVKALIDQRMLRSSAIRLLIFDEVDKLIAPNFAQEIDAIVSALPDRRQTLAFSATYTPDQLVRVASKMRTPQIVRVRDQNTVTVDCVASHESLEAWLEQEQSKNEPELWLRRVQQFYRVVQSTSTRAAAADALGMHAKIVQLVELLSDVTFSQCIVFCNDKLRAEALATALSAQNWPAVCITGAQSQATRLHVMDRFRRHEARILVATDLVARGIDIELVNFVVNLDLPWDPATYLHRVGRTVSLLMPTDVVTIQTLAQVFKMTIAELPTPVPRRILEYAHDPSAAATTRTKPFPPADANEADMDPLPAIPQYETISTSSDSSAVDDTFTQMDTEWSAPAPASQPPSPVAQRHPTSSPSAASPPPPPPPLSVRFRHEEQCYSHWRRLL